MPKTLPEVINSAWANSNQQILMHSDTTDAIVSLLLLVASLQMHFPTHGVTYLHRDIYTFAQFPQAILSLWLCKRVCMAKSLIRISLCNLMYLVCFSSQRTNDTIASQEFSNCHKCNCHCWRHLPLWWNFHYSRFWVCYQFMTSCACTANEQSPQPRVQKRKVTLEEALIPLLMADLGDRSSVQFPSHTSNLGHPPPATRSQYGQTLLGTRGFRFLSV